MLRPRSAASIALLLGLGMILASAGHARDEPDWRETAGDGCNASCTEGARSEGEAAFCKPFCACLVREIDDRKTNHSAERFLESLREGDSSALEENQKITAACLAELEKAGRR